MVMNYERFIDKQWEEFFKAAEVKYKYREIEFLIDYQNEVVKYIPDYYLQDHELFIEIIYDKNEIKNYIDAVKIAMDKYSALFNNLLIVGNIPYYLEFNEFDPIIPAFNYIYCSNNNLYIDLAMFFYDCDDGINLLRAKERKKSKEFNSHFLTDNSLFRFYNYKSLFPDYDPVYFQIFKDGASKIFDFYNAARNLIA